LEWYLDAGDVDRVRELRHEFADYLAANAAADGSDLAAAEVAFAELVANVHRHATGPAHVFVDWREETPVLTVSDCGPGFTPLIELPEPSSDSGRGLYIVAQLVGEVTVRRGQNRGAEVSVRLPVHRHV
jgi:anti-sigma regulatory factor (Ser/Thr protein kinase)